MIRPLLSVLTASIGIANDAAQGEGEDDWRRFSFDVFEESCITEGDGGIKYLPVDWDS